MRTDGRRSVFDGVDGARPTWLDLLASRADAEDDDDLPEGLRTQHLDLPRAYELERARAPADVAQRDAPAEGDERATPRADAEGPRSVCLDDVHGERFADKARAIPFAPSHSAYSSHTFAESRALRAGASDRVHALAAQVRRLRRTSRYGSRRGWELVPLISKANDDVRQEVFIMQLIRLFASALPSPLWLKPYYILSTGPRSGLIQAVTDAHSLHSLKGHPTFTSLRAYLESMHGGPGSPAFAAAQHNFAHSLAAYSIVCYVLGIKVIPRDLARSRVPPSCARAGRVHVHSFCMLIPPPNPNPGSAQRQHPHRPPRPSHPHRLRLRARPSARRLVLARGVGARRCPSRTPRRMTDRLRCVAGAFQAHT